jgi:hypothetical protein
VKYQIAALHDRIGFYENQVRLMEQTPMGRPSTAERGLTMMALGISDELGMLASRLGVNISAKVETPKAKLTRDAAAKKDEAGHARPDPGRIDPDKNEAFYAAHRKNIALLKRQLKSVEKKA